jgi:anti-sigma regulatory factor (Ser/Thr protein kinase)
MSGGTGAVQPGRGGAPSAGTLEHDSGAGTAIQNWPHASFLELAALPTAVPCARLHSKHVLWEWQLDYLAEDSELLVSELFSNAVKASWSPHGPGLVALRLLADYERLLIEVWDHNTGDPRPRQSDDSSESGRGFIVVEAISHRWGHERVSPTLKVVWCELLIGASGNGR